MKMPNNQLYYMEEPKLKFAFNQSAEDSRDGLTLFGPYEKNSSTIRVGVICTEKGLEYYRSFVCQMNKPIFTNSSGRPFFPGFKSVFGIEWPVEPTATIILSQSDLDTALAIKNLKE